MSRLVYNPFRINLVPIQPLQTTENLVDLDATQTFIFYTRDTECFRIMLPATRALGPECVRESACPQKPQVSEFIIYIGEKRLDD